MARERKFLMEQSPRSEQIQRVNAQGRGLFVRCDWTVDRYQHQIGSVIDGVEHAALISCEGTPDDPWPPSPPLQQFSMQLIDGNPALLGVGMAGSGHWSASFLLLENDSIELVIELACLVARTVVPKTGAVTTPFRDPLKSTYRVNEQFQILHAAADAAGKRTAEMRFPSAADGAQYVPSAGRDISVPCFSGDGPVDCNDPSIILQKPGLPELIAIPIRCDFRHHPNTINNQRLLVLEPASFKTNQATQWSCRVAVAG